MSEQATWLVTGAHGFLGANLGLHLEGRAHRVGAVRGATSTGGPYDRYVIADLERPDALLSFITQERPDVIVHAAAMASHEECERDPARAEHVNSTATGALAQAAQRAGSRFVLISTDAVFDGERGAYTEDDETKPTSVYGATKRKGERLAAGTSDALILRTNFFGWSPTGRRSILEFFVSELSAGRPVRGFTDFSTTSAYAQVLADTIWRLVETDASGLFHVASPDVLSKYEFGIAVAEEFGLPTHLITPAKADVTPPRGRDLSLDVSKAQALLGAELPTQREGVRRALADADTLRLRIAAATGP